MFLNVEYLATVRQHYGCNLLTASIIRHGNKITNRYVYAISSGTTSIGTDPTQFVTRQMIPNIDLISKDLHKLLMNNFEYFNLTSVDITSNDGSFSSSYNTQVKSTPAISASLGSSRRLR